MGIVFLAGSVGLTGTMQLMATDAEKRDIGGSLNDTLAFFPETSPWVRLLNVLGPWAGVIDGMATAIYERFVYIQEHRVRRDRPPGRPPQAVTTPQPSSNGETPTPSDEIFAPDPSRA